MAKLNAKDRKKVKSAEAVSGEFEPYPAGKYIGTLDEVEVRVSQNGNAMWNCTYRDLTKPDGTEMPGRQWYTLMLPQDKMPEGYKPSANALKRAEGDVAKAWENYQKFVAGKIKAFFEAHGYTEDSDTDEMIGEKAVLSIGIETIQSGAKAGQKTNRVNAVSALDGWEGGATADDEDDDF